MKTDRRELECHHSTMDFDPAFTCQSRFEQRKQTRTCLHASKRNAKLTQEQAVRQLAGGHHFDHALAQCALRHTIVSNRIVNEF